jgi:hypothetical protein
MLSTSPSLTRIFSVGFLAGALSSRCIVRSLPLSAIASEEAMVRMNGRITLAVLLICHTCWLVDAFILKGQSLRRDVMNITKL